LARSEYRFDDDLIIENIGLRASEYIYHKHLSGSNALEVVVLVGKGNNGSDGLAIARHLRRYNLSVRAFMLFPDGPYSPGLDKQLKMATAYDVKISSVKSRDQLVGYFTQTQSEYFVIDAIFGTGVRLPLSNFLFEVIETVNEYSQTTVAIDIPSGLCGDTGGVRGNAVKATETLAVGIPKIGHFLNEGPNYTGKMKVIDSGLPNNLLTQGQKILLGSSVVANLAKKRDPFAHKNVFGHTLVVGGSHGLTGALILASRASLKVGSGLVTALTWQDCYPEFSSRINPEVMTGKIPNDEELLKEKIGQLSSYDSVVVGPGLGKEPRARVALTTLLNSFYGPLVIDADAINAVDLEKDKELLSSRKAPTIFTPHIGEFARLMSADKQDIKESPLKYLQKFVEETNCGILLKGPCTYIGFPGQELFVHYLPNAGMATGGTGDVLAGVIGGLYAQAKYDPDTDLILEMQKFCATTCLSVVVHSVAGQHAVQTYGERAMMAGSIVDYLTEAFSDVREDPEDYDYEHHSFEE
jgi:hydroxyethylthiazole kinase-like uncharacterized protein yjeF